MDLGKLEIKAHEGEWLPIKAPDGTLLLEFLMVGKDSDECKAATRAAALKVRKKKDSYSPDDAEHDNMRAVMACIKDWRDPDTAEKNPETGKIDPETARHELTINGEKLLCTEVNKKRVLTDYPFIYRQADSHIVDDANFFKVSETA
jgi:hypothetical protein